MTAIRDTTRAFQLARDIRLSLPIKLLTPRIVKLFDRLEAILDRIDARETKPDPTLRKDYKPKLRKRPKARTKP